MLLVKLWEHWNGPRSSSPNPFHPARHIIPRWTSFHDGATTRRAPRRRAHQPDDKRAQYPYGDGFQNNPLPHKAGNKKCDQRGDHTHPAFECGNMLTNKACDNREQRGLNSRENENNQKESKDGLNAQPIHQRNGGA